MTSQKHPWIFIVIFLLAGSLGVLRADPADDAPLSLAVRSVTVGGKPVTVNRHGDLNLGAFPENIVIRFAPTTNLTRAPARLRYKIDGYENIWHSGDCEMFFNVRFFNDAGDQVDQTQYSIKGESAGWNGSIKTSPLTHRRESLTVPPQASRLMIVVSSAGPPATEGIYVIANLTVTAKSPGGATPTTLIRPPFENEPENNDLTQAPSGWMRDGNHASMAKVVKIGHDPAAKALAIYDDDSLSHAEWRNTIEAAPRVSPGDAITVEWNEMYSMGVGDIRAATYNHLESGSYIFRVEEVNIFGVPTGISSSMRITVSPPFWHTAWFWSAASFGIAMIIFGTGRYVTWHKVRREMLRLKSQQALEQERLRIAHDIHDDLGARVTQISLLSAVAADNSAFPEKARDEFGRVSQMCRELVFALYETVWAVNPENDNLDALGNYLCQMVNRLCEGSPFRCRFYVSELPRQVEVSSNLRHNISMTVKEAVHNVIKHASATEVIIEVEYVDNLLCISVRDDGRGFQLPAQHAGHGLSNMKRRLESIGGDCQVESVVGKGTAVRIKLMIKAGETGQVSESKKM